jgi:prevent-host-death family protein
MKFIVAPRKTLRLAQGFSSSKLIIKASSALKGGEIAQDYNKVYIVVILIIGDYMKLSTAVKPISYLKAHASELIRDITSTQQALVVTHNGEAKVVVQDIRSYERMQETLALLKILTGSKQNIKRGKVKSIEKTFGSLEKRIRNFKDEKI